MKHKNTNWMFALAAFIVLALASTFARADYNAPDGGWYYTYDGSFATGTDNVSYDWLDGSWNYGAGIAGVLCGSGQNWDGSGLGGTYTTGNAPGGVEAGSEGGVGFLRMQDPGEPDTATYGTTYMGNTAANNKGFSFGRFFTNLTYNAYDTGATLHFRVRVPTGTGLDPITVSTYTFAYPELGDGYATHNNGVAQFTLRNGYPSGGGPSGDDGLIQLSLCVDESTNVFIDTDATPYYLAWPTNAWEGLLMNSLQFDYNNNQIDWNEYATAGLTDPTPVNEIEFVSVAPGNMRDWNEFWIQIVENDSTPSNGTHTLTIWKNGEKNPTTRNITAGNEWSEGYRYEYPSVMMGMCRSSATGGGGGITASGALDIDYFSIAEGLYAPPPSISAQPSPQSVDLGDPATFTVSANAEPSGVTLSYQWLKAGAPISGETDSSYTIASAQYSDVADDYSVVVSNDIGGFVYSDDAGLTVGEEDTTAPTVTISAPANNSHSVAPIGASGTATDDQAVKKVQYSLNGGAYQDASGAETWSVASLDPLLLGANTLDVKSIDYSDNESSVESRTFYLDVVGTLTVNAVPPEAGSAAASGGPPYNVGETYEAEATVNANYLFNKWTYVADGGPETDLSTDLETAFTMATNLTLNANFVTNWFGAAAGTYNGLLVGNSGVAQPDSGFVSVKVNSKQKFSGKLYVDGNKVSMAGSIAVDGTGTLKKLVDRSKFSKGALTASLTLNQDDTMTGTVAATNGDWTSTFSADRATFEETLNPCTDYVGTYTMVIPGADPVKGDGYATVSIDLDGVVKAKGFLAEGYLKDGKVKTQKAKYVKTSISKDGDWPLHARLYKSDTTKQYQGLLQAWMAFTGDATPANRALTNASALIWIKPAGIGYADFYGAGFSNAIAEVLGSPYVEPTPPNRALTVPTDTATVDHTDGNLTASFDNQFDWLGTLDKNGYKKLVNPDGKLSENGEKTIAIVTKKGEFKGKFVHPDLVDTKVMEQGVVLQNANVGRGFFLGNSESGAVTLTPDTP